MGSPKPQHWKKLLAIREMSTLRVGMILYFSTNKLADPTNNEPHYLIIMAIDGNTVYFVCCQTSEKSANNQVRAGKDNSTIPCIKNSPENGLKWESYVDCNRSIDSSIHELTTLYELGRLEIRGNVSLGDYLQLKHAILQSKVNDLPEELLVHPEDN